MEINQLKTLIKEKLQGINYDLVSLEKNGQTLSLVVDRVAPIDMEAIVEVTHLVSDYLDEINPFDGAYTLDISSLGAEKPLQIKDLDKYVNSYVHVHMVNPIDGENILEGHLVAVNDDNITLSYRIKTRVKNVDIEKTNISKIRLAIKF